MFTRSIRSLSVVLTIGSSLFAAVPGTLQQTGVVAVAGERFTGNGLFRFALVDPSSDEYLWTNDGSLVVDPTPPTAGVTLVVVNGVYSVPLGDASIMNMTAIPTFVFNENSDVVLRVWFDDLRGNGLHQLAPDLPIDAVPFALHARAAEQLHLSGSDVPHVFLDPIGQVGVGTTAPEGPFHVFEGSAGAVTAHSNSIAAFERSATGYLSILTPDDTERGILFGDPEDFVNGGIVYNSPSIPDGLNFRTGGNLTRMAITNAGNVGIGVTSPSDRLVVSGAIRSTAGGYIFPDASVQTKAAFGDGHSLDASDGSPTDALFVSSFGVVGIGTTAPLGNRLHAVGFGGTSIFSPLVPNSHTEIVESTSVFDGIGITNGAAVLGLQSRWANVPGSEVNFISFFNSTNQAIGAVDGNGAFGVTYRSGSGDFAEYLPKLNRTDSFQPGEVVGIVNGSVSRSLAGADCAMVVSTAPCVLGNSPQPSEAPDRVIVAMLGQVPVRIVGSVAAGDFVIADPARPGLAVAASPSEITPSKFRWIIGRAWESSSERDVKLINTAIGLPGAHVASMTAELESQRGLLDSQSAELVGQREEMESQRARLESLEARLAALEHSISGG
ncbi:MAG: hypothetical protein HOP29_10510 [Phycisphaerales bacterium]|nr:hypothetical protein [Phycisphaerales bacterium]